LDRAISIYKNKEEWKKIMRKCMEVDFSWEKSSLEYLKLYKKIYEEL
jgi:starch synthase